MEILPQVRPHRISQTDYAALVAGSGPAGLAAVGTLLEKGVPGKVLWVDPEFAAGKIDKSWREVPSNIKVELFLSYANALEPFRQVVAQKSKPNAITALEELEQDKGCQLSYAADMCLMLSKGLRDHPQVQSQRAKVIAADWNSRTSRWTVEISHSTSEVTTTVSSRRLVLCTGSTANFLPIPVQGLTIQRVDIETGLAPSVLRSVLPKDSSVTVAVVGASHSAVLVLLNLYNLTRTTAHSRLRIIWFTRSELRYAEQKDGWILHDNTGLKGQAADFARENLEDSTMSQSPVGAVVRKVFCGEDEQQVYEKWLPDCTHIIQATGFSANQLPMLTVDREPLAQLQFDGQTGGFFDKHGIEVPGLYGTGIAYPERVKDPLGNVEHNVGFWKFMTFLERAGGQWAKDPRGYLPTGRI